MKRYISALLILTMIFMLLCGCKDQAVNNEQQKQGEDLTVTFNNENGPMPAQTEPIEPLNKAMEKEELDFKGDHYGVIINNGSADEVDAANVETFDNGGSDTIIVMPYYKGSKVLVESVVYDMNTNGIVPTATLYETTSTDDFALVVKVNRPEGVMPEMRITVEYDGQVYSNLIKNIPDAEIEYIR